MKNWIRHSFRNRLFATILLVTLLPLFLCNYLMLQIQIQRSRVDQREAACAQLAGVDESLSRLFGDISQVSHTLADSTIVRSVLRREKTESRILYQELSRVASELRGLATVEVTTASGLSCYTSEGTGGSRLLNTDWGILHAAGEAGGLVWRPGENGGAVEAAQAVRGRDGTVLGYIFFTVTQQALDSLLEKDYSLVCNVILLDSFWEAVYCSQGAKARETTAMLRSRLLDGESLADGASECGYYVQREANTGFILILEQPLTFTGQAVNTFYSISVTLGIMCLLLCLVSSLWLSRHLSQPVRALSDAMGAVRRGNFDVHVEVTREDELGMLAESFNRMASGYRDNLERTLQRQQELQQTQIRMMQAQLNPHFLYNTLDSMKWMGLNHGAPELATMATDLAALLRFSISQEDVITLEQELELLERYLEIQYIRFEDRFTCEIDIPEQFQHCRIPKLALQPIVENAIIHGVADQDDGYIKLTGGQERNTLVLTVTDNGCGMAPDQVQRLNDPDKHLPEGHLGLYNVDRIAKLHYGSQYGITVESARGEGTVVRLRLPMITEENVHA